MSVAPLKPEELYRRYDPAALGFRTTADLDGTPEVIGQPRVLAALRRALVDPKVVVWNRVAWSAVRYAGRGLTKPVDPAALEETFLARLTLPSVAATVDRIGDIADLPAAIARYCADQGLQRTLCIPPDPRLAACDWTGFTLHDSAAPDEPAALAIAKDGSLLVADDTGGTIWKVRYTGEAPAMAPAAATTGMGDGKAKK